MIQETSWRGKELLPSKCQPVEPVVDVLVVPIGGGGLISGVATAVEG